MRSLRVFLMIGVAAAVLPLAPAFAEWSPEQRRTFRGGCIESCQRDGAKAIWCQNYCVCVTSEIEKAYPTELVFERLMERPDAAFNQRRSGIDQTCRNRF
jgi:hypothetical protein